VTVLKAVVRNSAIRPVAATAAAEELRAGFAASVVAEVRWAFAPPRAWLVGVGVNLVLSLVWLLVDPLSEQGPHDWVIIVGTYFASFILADVTTTNVLGVDRIRVQKCLDDGMAPWRILAVKNLALLVIVGVPTLAVAMLLTLWFESPARLAITVPEVSVPLLCWLGLGNLLSALFPVGYQPLIRRWRQRGDLSSTARWLAHLALPYALYYLADPVDGLPQIWFWGDVPGLLNLGLGPDGNRSVVHIGAAFAVWAVGTVAAHLVICRRGLGAAWQPNVTAEPRPVVHR
jgi:hypothetical protein